jgi:hypothetical protein
MLFVIINNWFYRLTTLLKKRSDTETQKVFSLATLSLCASALAYQWTH